MACTGGETLPGEKPKARHSVYPKGIGAEAPAWVAFDRQVLKKASSVCSVIFAVNVLVPHVILII